MSNLNKRNLIVAGIIIAIVTVFYISGFSVSKGGY